MGWQNKNIQIMFFFKVQNSIKIIDAIHWWNQACFFCGYFWVFGMPPVHFFHGWAIGKWASKWPQPQVSNWANSFVVMFRSSIFRSSGGLGPDPFGPRAGRSFLHRSSVFFSVFLRHVKDHNSLKKGCYLDVNTMLTQC